MTSFVFILRMLPHFWLFFFLFSTWLWNMAAVNVLIRFLCMRGPEVLRWPRCRAGILIIKYKPRGAGRLLFSQFHSTFEASHHLVRSSMSTSMASCSMCSSSRISSSCTSSSFRPEHTTQASLTTVEKKKTWRNRLPDVDRDTKQLARRLDNDCLF